MQGLSCELHSDHESHFVMLGSGLGHLHQLRTAPPKTHSELGVCAVLDGRVVAEAHEQRDSESAINTFILELSDC